MTGADDKPIRRESGEMKITLQFPAKTEREDVIRQEVREILFCALREYLQKLP